MCVSVCVRVRVHCLICGLARFTVVFHLFDIGSSSCHH